MKKRLTFVLTGVAVFFLCIITTKASSEISFETKAGSYQYKVIMGQKPFTWGIGHKGSESVFEENENNLERLEKFRNSVEDIKQNKFRVIFSVFYLFVIGMALVVAKRKKKEIGKEYLMIIMVFAGIAFYYGLTASFELNNSFKEAKYYYYVLTH